MGLARLGLPLFGAVVPIAILVCLVGGAGSPTPAAVSFGLIAFALICRLTPTPRPLSTFLAYPALLFVLLPLLQALPLPAFLWRRMTAVDATLQAEVAQLGAVLPPTWSFEPEATLHSAVVAIAALAVFLLARHATRRRHALWTAIILLTALAAWQSIEGLRQYFAGLWLLDDGEFAHGHFANRGYYAAFLNAGFWLAAGAAYSQAVRPNTSLARAALAIGFSVSAVVALVATAASHSRSALLTLSLLALATIALLPLSRYKRAVLALWSVAGTGIFLSSPIARPLVESFSQLYELGGDPGRLAIWRDALSAFTPVGYGAGSFPWALERTTPYLMRQSVDTAHGDYVEWAVEFGPWLAGLFALSLAAALVHLLRQSQRVAVPERRALALGPVFGASALALHALKDSVLHSQALLFLLACLLGLACGLNAPIPSQRQRVGTGLLAAGLCVSTLLLGGALTPLSVASLFPAARQQQLRGDFSGARRGYVDVLRANPRTAPAWLALAEIARLEGDTPLALRHVRTARSVEPWTYRVEWAFADLQLATGDLAGGVERLRILCEQLPDIRPASYLLAYRSGARLELIERRLTTPEPYAVGEYLAFLIRSGNLQELEGAYQRLVERQAIELSEAHRQYLASFADGSLP